MLSSEDFEENPGTLALALAWILVFALIQVVEWRDTPPAVPQARSIRFEPLPVTTTTSHRFGDMTWREVRQGEAWRLVTATFVHFGLIHLVLNGMALLNLGRLVEPWYRTGPFLAVCLAIGGLGNLVGGAIRQGVGLAQPWLASQAVAWHLPQRVERFFQAGPGGPVSIHTGGGSTILLGLLTLGAVVGWRSRTRVGAHLQKQMLILLALTAVLGVAMYRLVDNYGHLGGAIVGALIGWLDPPLVRLSASKGFRRLSWLGVAVVSLACLGIAIRDDRDEAGRNRQFGEIARRLILDDGLRRDLEQLYSLYVRRVVQSSYFAEPSHELDALAIVELLKGGPTLNFPKEATTEQLAADRAELAAILERLDKVPPDLGGSQVSEDLATLRSLIRSAIDRPVTYQDAYDFLVAWKPTLVAISRDLAEWNARALELDQRVRRSE